MRRAQSVLRIVRLVFPVICVVLAIFFSNVFTNRFDTGLDMPSDFQITYAEWYNENQKTVLDTFKKTLQKDLGSNGVASTSINPTVDFRMSLYTLVTKYNLTEIDREMTDSVLVKTGTQHAVEPCRHYHITFQIRQKIYTIDGDETAKFSTDQDVDAKNFMAFIEDIRAIMTDMPEYQDMPESSGGYL